jgi:hypothetical protein
MPKTLMAVMAELAQSPTLLLWGVANVLNAAGMVHNLHLEIGVRAPTAFPFEGRPGRRHGAAGDQESPHSAVFAAAFVTDRPHLTSSVKNFVLLDKHIAAACRQKHCCTLALVCPAMDSSSYQRRNTCAPHTYL